MEWISATDRLPKMCWDYLVTDGKMQTVAYFNLSGVWDFYDDPNWNDIHVTHWMFLPELPKK